MLEAVRWWVGAVGLLLILAGCGGGEAKKDKGKVQPLDRVVVSTPGNWAEMSEQRPPVPPRQVTTAPSATAPAGDAEVPVLAVRATLSLMGTGGDDLGDEFLPVQEIRSGETKRVMLGDATDGAEVVFAMGAVREGEALLRIGMRMWGRRQMSQTWVARMDGTVPQTFQAVARGAAGGRVRLTVAVDGIPQKPLEAPEPRSVLEELRRRQPPPP